jgi:hypothetical protein
VADQHRYQALHRRKKPRLRVGIPARLETLYETVQVTLIDLSQTGAKMEIPDRRLAGSAVLNWLSFEALGDVMWQEGDLAGLQFDPSVPLDYLLATRELAPNVVAKQHLDARAAAAAWVWGRS